jgi:hypothetical protein
MRGLSNNSKDLINQIVDRLFDRMGHTLLGNIPAYRNKKTVLFTSNPLLTLAHLFLMGLQGARPLPKEEEIMKNMLDTAHSYLESLRSRTKARLTESVDSYMAEARIKNVTPSSDAIRERVTDSLEKAKSDMKRIAEAEATKARNLGKLMNIARVGAALGQPDPNVFFVMIKDTRTCDECKKLHLWEDGITPRVWKMSQLGFSYHHKGEHNPKVCGLHPHCRCTLTLLSPGFGFKNGVVAFISPDHDEYKRQQEAA